MNELIIVVDTVVPGAFNLQGRSGGENTLNAILIIRFVAYFFMPHPSLVGSNTDTAPLHHLYSIFSILCANLFFSAYILRLRRETNREQLYHHIHTAENRISSVAGPNT